MNTGLSSTDVFFKKFLMLSDTKTLIFLALLVVLFFIINFLSKKKVSFAKRVLIGMALGLILGLVIQFTAGFPKNPAEVVFIQEISAWYEMFGSGFIDLIRMLIIPLVMISIIHVIIQMDSGVKVGKMVRNTIIITMLMVMVAAVVGLLFAMAFSVGKGMDASINTTGTAKQVVPIVKTLRGLLPANPVSSMVDLNVIGLVIFSAFLGMGARRMFQKYMDIVKPFFDLIGAIHKVIISIAMTVIKLMPYAVIPLLANTIAGRGVGAILEVGKFIIVLYAALITMFIIQLAAITASGLNPLYYLRKSLHVMIMAFTSRSSVGTLPVTIDALTNRLGVSAGTANFVASFGSTAGMQGCAGVFPAMLVVFVCNVANIPIDFTLIIMSVIVISIGSLGIAGIPGTATMAASVALSGVGMSAQFPLISPVIAIDPLIDMGRTFLNVTGAMTNAMIVDRTLGTFDHGKYTDMNLKGSSGDVDN